MHSVAKTLRATSIRSNRIRGSRTLRWCAAAMVLSLGSALAGDMRGATECAPAPGGAFCQDALCPPQSVCSPRCIRFFPQSGFAAIEACECRSPEGCTAVMPFGPVNPCLVPEVGEGTVHLPPQGCTYTNDGGSSYAIIDGLPPGAFILADGAHTNFMCTPAVGVCSFSTAGGCDQPGGSLGGEQSCAESQLQLNMQGFGSLSGFTRFITLPVGMEIHTAPRTPGQPIQSFPTEMFRMFGQVTGDPDFDLLRISGGNDFGLPSPGHTTLTLLPGGNWAVDSFFDITYRIDFVGRPGGALSGLSGSTTGIVRIQTGTGPTCSGVCPPGFNCREYRTVDANGTILICCECEPIVCGPTLDQRSCEPVACPQLNQSCAPRCRRYFPQSGTTIVDQCECRDAQSCQSVPPSVPNNPCVVTETGTGTVHLPPVGCGYRSPPSDLFQIIDGLPPGNTIDIPGDITNFMCSVTNGLCTFALPPTCYAPGGVLGGERSCAKATFPMAMQGTGGLGSFSRFISMPIELEIHAAPRTPFMPVQAFPTQLYRMFGQVTGDPDFDLLRITAGNDFGLPSPGHTTLRQLPGGNWAVDSFFDITYRIDFVGAPGGALAGRSGSTTGTVRVSTGGIPDCEGVCPPGDTCHRTVVVSPDGSISVCCDCVPPCVCRGDMNANGFVNGDDAQGFVNCYLLYGPSVPPVCVCADMDSDGVLSPVDINLFVDKLLLDPNTACP